MIKVGIELNHVVRNINKQILKYYQKDIDQSLDIDDIDEKDDAFKYAKFETLTDKNDFIYIDYPYEIYGCAKTMDKELPALINNWLSELTNYEEDEIEISFFSLNEEALTIQSSYFFLSKIGTRVRKIIFPKSINEIRGEYDVVIAGSKEVLDFFKGDNESYVVQISNNMNKDCEADKKYDSLNDVIKDDEFIGIVQEFVNNKNNKNIIDGESN
jgi:hypothetical protein